MVANLIKIDLLLIWSKELSNIRDRKSGFHKWKWTMKNVKIKNFYFQSLGTYSCVTLLHITQNISKYPFKCRICPRKSPRKVNFDAENYFFLFISHLISVMFPKQFSFQRFFFTCTSWKVFDLMKLILKCSKTEWAMRFLCGKVLNFT